jgi:sulfatase maturation enzyme AslB (radical SAM superfamily)
MKNPTGNINNNTIDEIANSKELKFIRKSMLNDIPNPNCIECNVKDLSNTVEISHKVMQNTTFKTLIPSLIEHTAQDGSLTESFKMRYMNIRYSNLCNMSCRTCGDHSSSLWAQEKLSQHPVVKITDTQPNYLEEIFQRLHEVDVISFAGGESTLIPEHWEVLDKLIELDKMDVRITYFTNLSKLNYQSKHILDYTEIFKNFTLLGSIDASHARAELYRNGTHWPTIEKNLKIIYETNTNFKINCTVGAMNVWHAPDLEKHLIENNLIKSHQFSINMLIQSEMQSAKILPLYFKFSVMEKINKHKEWLTSQCIKSSHWDTVIKFMFSEDHSHLINKFVFYNLKLDKIRNQDTFTTFPELSCLINHNT